MGSPDLQIVSHLKHVKEGQEYLINGSSEQAVTGSIFSSDVAEDKFSSCSSPEDGRSFFDFHTEDIERTRNVSFSHQNYTGKVTLVVNLASF